MKLETLAKKLAAKTGTPVLEAVILGQEPVTALPDHCMLWTGAMTYMSGQPRQILRRDRQGRPFTDFVPTIPYAVVRYQGRRHLVQRLIFQLVAKPDFEFRLSRLCTDVRCVHPMHWEVHEISHQVPEVEEEPLQDDQWSYSDMVEIIEILLTEQSPASWDEVISAPIMEGAPHDLAREVLRDLNKGHLT